MLKLDDRAAAAANDPLAQEALIREYKPFILKCASDCSKRYVTDSDDEWSIALQGFTEALAKYRRSEGSFLGFAKLVIRRRLYDYFDVNQKTRNEIPVPPALFSGETEEDEAGSDLVLQMRQSLTYQPDTSITGEIAAVNSVLAEYGFSFFDLTDCSPKAAKTKTACAQAAACLLQNRLLLDNLRQTKQLPIKIVANHTGIPRKILERHRKYIIAAVEMLTGDYPYLADYLRPIREELNK